MVGLWKISVVWNDLHLQFLQTWQGRVQSCWWGWPVSAAVGYSRWWFADQSGPFPSVQCSPGCQGCCARPATCPAGSPPPQRSAILQQPSNKALNKRPDLFPRLVASMTTYGPSWQKMQPASKSKPYLHPEHVSPTYRTSGHTISLTFSITDNRQIQQHNW